MLFEISTLSSEYRCRLSEFDVTLSSYASADSHLAGQLQGMKAEVQFLRASTQVEAERADSIREEIEMTKERVARLKKLREAKGAEAEAVYDAMRDAGSAQEERVMVQQEMLGSLKCGASVEIEAQSRAIAEESEMYKNANRRTQTSSPASSPESTYMLQGQVSSLEKEQDRSSEKRSHLRSALEHLKKRLPAICLEPLHLSSTLQEAESLCSKLKGMDRDTLLALMRERDDSKKTWLANFLNGELRESMSSERHELQQMTASQGSDT